MKRTLVLSLIALTTAVTAQGPPPAQVRVAEALQANLAAQLELPATVISRSDARVSAEFSGRLASVAEVGVRLSEGDALAQIDKAVPQLQLAEARAQLQRAKAQVEFARAEEKRLKELAERNVTAANALDRARADRLVAEADVAIAQARIAQLEDALQRTTLRAPFDGVVVERFAEPGERVSVGDPVVRMLNRRSLELVSRAPLEYFSQLREGQSLAFTVGENTHEGQLRAMVELGSESVHLFELRVDIPPQLYPIGTTARIILPTGGRTAFVSVPRDALVLRPEGAAVFVLQDDATVRRVPVQTGQASGDRIGVQGDVAPGDRVVVRGNERLRDGQAVTVSS